jgi:hypothetical protein
MMIQLPVDWVACERGNTLLSSGEGNMIAWLDLPGGEHRLEVSFTPDNYPALNVQVVDLSDEGLADHINSELCGWLVHKCSVRGVKSELNRVTG